MPIDDDREKVLIEIRKFPRGAPQADLKRRLGIHGNRMSQIMNRLKDEGLILHRGKCWIINKDHTPSEQPAPKEPVTLEGTLASLERQDSEQMPAISEGYVSTLKEIYSQSIGKSYPFAVKSFLQTSENILDSLKSMDLVMVMDNSKVYLTIKGLQACDNKWIKSRVVYSVLEAIQDIDSQKDPRNRPTAVSIAKQSGLHNAYVFSEILDDLLANEYLAFEIINIRNLKAYVLTQQGGKLLFKLQKKFDPSVQTPAQPVTVQVQHKPADTPKPQMPQPIPQYILRPAPVPVPVPAPSPQPVPKQDLTEIVFGWGKVKPEAVRIGNNTYNVIVLDGRVGGRAYGIRVREARGKGYIGMTSFELETLKEFSKYVSADGFNMQAAEGTIVSGMKLYRFKIKDLLDKYDNKGIKFPKVINTQIPAAETPAAPSANYSNIIKYEKGQAMERAVLENIVNELADLRKRVENLEKK